MLDIKVIESFYPEHLRKFKRHLLREYLQYKILDAISNDSSGRAMVFMGGTAIHLAHQSSRFSEDLDFDNQGLAKNEFLQMLSRVQKKLEREGYVLETSESSKGAYRGYLKFIGLLQDAGISSLKDEKLLIQVDTEPQGYRYASDSFMLNKFDVFTKINIVPVNILLAQKLYAVLMRKRPMGRDFFDALYLSGKTTADAGYLTSKLKVENMKDVKKALLKKCDELDFKQLQKDVEPFLYNPDDAKRIGLFREYVVRSM